MVKTVEAQVVGTTLTIGIVVGRFNEFINDKLLAGAIDGLKRHGVVEDNIEVAWVPGAFEVPFIAKKMAESKKYDAVIGLGRLFAGQRRIMIMFVMKRRKASHKSAYKQASLQFSASLLLKRLSKPSNVLALKQATKAMMPQ